MVRHRIRWAWNKLCYRVAIVCVRSARIYVHDEDSRKDALRAIRWLLQATP